jgi:hypothetical protein
MYSSNHCWLDWLDLEKSNSGSSGVQKELDQLKRTYATAKEEFEERSKALRENLKTVYAQHSALSEEKKGWDAERKRLLQEKAELAAAAAAAAAASKPAAEPASASAPASTSDSATASSSLLSFYGAASASSASATSTASSEEVQELREQLKRKVSSLDRMNAACFVYS